MWSIPILFDWCKLVYSLGKIICYCEGVMTISDLATIVGMCHEEITLKQKEKNTVEGTA